MERITVVGGGFAGVEAAWAAARMGMPVRLYEMRPHKQTPAHKTGFLAELVCSNSFKSMLPTTPAGQLKWEMQYFGSLMIPTALNHTVPAGEALAVEREGFAAEITVALENEPLVEIVREEVTDLPDDRPLIVATGPLTSDALAQSISQKTGSERLHFYDAVSPIVDASTIDYNKVFIASRYDKGDPGYINCPFMKEEYEAFWQAVISAERVPLHDFEETRFFEGCVPMEELADRGPRTLAFGPFKPVGLTDPKTGRRPHAVLQLRPENTQRSLYSLVACQTRLKWGEQKRVFRMVPGLENAEFIRYGVIHRNTYLDSPRLLHPTLQLRSEESLFFAGQLVGVEGYVESAASGIIAGINAARWVQGKSVLNLPPQSVIGSLLHYIASYPHKEFPPMNANWGLLPDPILMIKDKERKRAWKLEQARAAIEALEL